jgi:hypothetical protein
MSDSFFDDVVASTKKHRAGSSLRLATAPLRLHPDFHLFGKDAGEDFARTYFDQLKVIIDDHAASRAGNVNVQIPICGKSALDALEATFRNLLNGFTVSATSNSLVVDWESHL